jgi:hypothetical protein
MDKKYTSNFLTNECIFKQLMFTTDTQASKPSSGLKLVEYSLYRHLHRYVRDKQYFWDANFSLKPKIYISGRNKKPSSYYKVFFAQNVCKSSSNMRVIVLRFLWEEDNHWGSTCCLQLSNQGRQIFLGTYMIPKQEKCTKWTQNIPTDHKYPKSP